MGNTCVPNSKAGSQPKRLKSPARRDEETAISATSAIVPDKIVIPLKGRLWNEIEESIACLPLRFPNLAIPHDIKKYFEVISIIFPASLRSMIADYSAASGPLLEPYNSIFQLRTYALYRSGRLKETMFCISSLRFGFTNDKCDWLNRLGVEAYYGGQYELARHAFVASGTTAEGDVFETPNNALVHALNGDFATALAVTKTMEVADSKAPGHSHLSWKLLIRGWSFAGLGMHADALRELCACINQSGMPYITALAVAFKNAIDERGLLAPLSAHDRTQWALDVHRNAAQSQSAVSTSGWFREDDSVTYVIS